MERKLVIAILCVLGCVALNSLYNAFKTQPYEINSEINLTQHEQTETNNELNKNMSNIEKKIVVYIEGAIAKPGLVYLTNDARIGEVVDAAGGFLANADINNLNLAEKVTDGQKITIPTKNKNDVLDGIASKKSSNNDELININTATESELTKLPRVGASTAKKIIEYREKHGKFKTIDELKNVSGIGEKTFEKLKDKIKV